jgi:hypothetical protein
MAATSARHRKSERVRVVARRCFTVRARHAVMLLRTRLHAQCAHRYAYAILRHAIRADFAFTTR